MQRLVLDELELVGCRASAGEMRRVMPLVEQGRMRVRDVMTHRFTLAEYGRRSPRSTTPRAGPSRSSSGPERPAACAPARPAARALQESRSVTYVYDCDHRHDLPFAEVKRAHRRQGRQPRRHGRRPRPARPAGVHDHDGGLQRVPRPRLAGRARRRAARAHGAGSRSAVGRRFGDAGRPAPRERPVRRAGLDARDDGHDPQPRPQRRDDRRPRGGARGARSSPATAGARFDDDVPRHRRQRRRARGSRGPSSGPPSRPSSAPGTATGRATYRRREGIPDDLGTAVTVQAMVFGNRSVDSGHGRPLHPQPGDRRAGPVRRRHVQRPGRGRRGRHPPRRSRSTILDERMPDVGRELREYAGAAGAPPPRPVRHRVHHRARDAVDAPVSGSASGARRRRSGSPSTWPRTRRSRSRGPRPSSGSRRSWPTRPTIATERGDVGPALATGPARLAGRRLRRDRDDARRRRRRGRGRPDGDPRPGRDVARRRPRHGPGGRRSSPRPAGSPATPRSSPAAGGSRRSSAPRTSRSPASGSSIGGAALARRRDDHHRRRDRRGLRGRGRPARQVVPEAATLLGLGHASSGSRSAPRPSRAGRGAARRRPAARQPRRPARRPRSRPTTCCAPSSSRATPRRRRSPTALLVAADEASAAPRPARRRRPRRDRRRLVPADRRRQGGRQGADRRRHGSAGAWTTPTRRSTRSSSSTTG